MAVISSDKLYEFTTINLMWVDLTVSQAIMLLNAVSSYVLSPSKQHCEHVHAYNCIFKVGPMVITTPWSQQNIN